MTLAQIEAARGHRAEAERLAEESLALARSVFGATARQTAQPALLAARFKANRGKLDAAIPLYEASIAAGDPANARPLLASAARIQVQNPGLGSLLGRPLAHARILLASH